MRSKEVVVANVGKKYENPIAQLVQLACQYTSSLYLKNDEHQINAKSIMGIMAFNPTEGERVTVTAEGQDENEAVEAMESFLLCQ